MTLAAPVQSTDEPTSGSASPLTIARFNDYRTLILALSTAREYRKMSFEAMDELVGASKGYWSKVLAPNGTRHVTMQSLGDGFSALAVDCAMMLNEAEWDRIKHRVASRKKYQVRGGTFNLSFSRRFMRRIGKKGGLARMHTMDAKRRSASARNAALARWRKPKIVEERPCADC